MALRIVSENYFKYDNSDYAKSLRLQFGENGYQKYTQKMNSIMTNPLEESKKEYAQAKEAQYKNALTNLAQTKRIWNNYNKNYQSNLITMKNNNNGISLTGEQKTQALQASGTGALTAYNNFKDAQSEADYALSLWNDATHSGVNFLS
jgi:hypothetical protein